MKFFVDGIGVLGPGMPDWPTARAVLAGERDVVPAPVVLPAIAALPAAERRRTGAVVKLAVSVGLQALAHARRDPSDMATVFTSSGADGDTIHAILSVLTTGDCQISPTRFHNSVHNAPSGYWALACKAMAPSTSLCGFDGSFAMGLLDAVAQVCVDRRPVTLISYDHPYPEPLNTARLLQTVFGVSLVLCPERSDSSLAELHVTTRQSKASGCTMMQPELEAIRRDNPAARSLPLLRALARGRGAQTREDVVIEGIENMLVDVTVVGL
jgi:hypothetical protein